MKDTTTTTDKATARPWLTDDRHIHPAKGLTYPPGVEPETDVIVLVDTDCHNNGLLNETDKANLALIVRAVNEHAALVAVAEAAKKVQYEVGKLARLSHEDDTYAAWSELTDQLNALAAVRAGKGGQS